MANSPTEQTADLARAMGFSLEELTLNRAGQISSHQAWENLRMVMLPAGIAVVFLGMFVLFLYVTKPHGLARALYALPIVGFVVMSGLALYFAVAAYQHRVLLLEGPLHFQQGRGGPSIFIEGVWATDSPRAAWQTLVEGRRYRMYYIARSRRFLSIEPVD